VQIDKQQLDSLSDEGKLIMMWTTEIMQKLTERVARLEQELGKQ
jgi:hypothetical protein